MSGGVALLTGFPALRARHVLRELLRVEAARRVVALVTPDREEEARALLATPELARAEVEFELADPAAIDFGLEGRRYLELARSVEVVHAAYSVTDVLAEEQLAERVNIGAARELCEFSRVSRQLARVVLYSSVFVSGQRSGPIAEDELEAGQSFRSGVERSLAIAERMLARRRVPRVVLRAGHVLGQGEPGSFPAATAPHLLLAFVASAPRDVALPMLPRADAALPLTPLQFLAEFGVFAARSAAQTTFHVIDPAQLSLGQFYELAVRACGRQLDTSFNPSALTRVLLGTPALRLVPQNLRRILEALASSARYATDGAVAVSQAGGPHCPALESYLQPLLEQLRDPERHEALFSARPPHAPFLV